MKCKCTPQKHARLNPAWIKLSAYLCVGHAANQTRVTMVIRNVLRGCHGISTQETRSTKRIVPPFRSVCDLRGCPSAVERELAPQWH